MTTASSVRIREVGPRDGFQNEPEHISTDDKVRLIEALGRAGLTRIEVASFVRPDVIPQLSDGVEVLKKNVNRTVEETMADNEVMAKRIRAEGLNCAAVIATSFGCPYEGRVELSRVLDLAERFAEAGATEIGFGDTTGMAHPAYAGEFFAAALQRLPDVEITAHFHNTRGQGLANAYAALLAGCTSFESSFGELGGCPVPPGSTGNIATEDLVNMFHEMGVDTGIDLPAVIDAARQAQTVLGRSLTSHCLVAGPVIWH
jgi:hydroxymethylglutaryl-CoA lyase